MSESEAKFFGFKWEPPSEDEVPDPKVEARRNRLLAENLHLAVDSAPAPPPKPAPARRSKQRQHNAATEQLYARIREIPRDVPLKEFCKRCDRMQRRFPTPRYWQDDGCPSKWFEGWRNLGWREKIHDLRQNAWRNVIKKTV
jgi:hypothetical protein